MKKQNISMIAAFIASVYGQPDVTLDRAIEMVFTADPANG